MKRSLYLLALGAPLLLGAALPKVGPVPAGKPAEKIEPAPDAKEPSAPPALPAQEDRQPGTTPAAPEPPKDAQVPAPVPKPEEKPSAEPFPPSAPDATPKPEGKEQEEEKSETPPPPPPPPLVKENPEELKACLTELSTLGAKFRSVDPIDDGNGCGVESPVEITEVLPGVELGGAIMRCKTAVTMAHWLKDTVQPALNIAIPGRKITRVMPGSTYECRLRNGASTGKISEHARGNAFDVAAFKLDDGATVEMKPRDEDSTLEGAFQRTATAGACLHFTTVLSPGSDEAHQNHLHLDILERENGYRYCR